MQQYTSSQAPSPTVREFTSPRSHSRTRVHKPRVQQYTSSIRVHKPTNPAVQSPALHEFRSSESNSTRVVQYTTSQVVNTCSTITRVLQAPESANTSLHPQEFYKHTSSTSTRVLTSRGLTFEEFGHAGPPRTHGATLIAYFIAN